MKPQVLLLDEITLGPRPGAGGRGQKTSSAPLTQEGIAMVLVTHAMSFAREIAHRIAYLADGQIAEIGPPQQSPGPAPRPGSAGLLAPDPLTAWPRAPYRLRCPAAGAPISARSNSDRGAGATRRRRRSCPSGHKMPDHEQERGADGDRQQARNGKVRCDRLELLLVLPDLEFQAITQLMQNGRVAQIELGDFPANVEG